ncbi:MAG: hldE, partial [Planctomycetaceae bacterium]|nr:hldE [Planctomycetaceae bacterium]
GWCFANDKGWDETLSLINAAAGLEVERFGVAPVSWPEIRAELSGWSDTRGAKVVDRDELAALGAACRQAGKRVVFTNGCFDLLHVGHVTVLQQAADLGDVLVVGINSDASVRRLKGPGRPVIGERDRATLLAALGCVSHVVVFDEETPLDLLQRLRPDVLVKGGTYRIDEVVGREIVESYEGEVRVVGYVEGVSTTRILAGLKL